MSKFNDSLHEDLFDLFILAMVNHSPWHLENFETAKRYLSFIYVKDLMPLELATESYEVFCSMVDIWELRDNDGESGSVYYRSEKNGRYEHKIKITIGAE